MDEIVAQHLVGRQELVQSARKEASRPARKRIQTVRCHDEDHYATRRLLSRLLDVEAHPPCRRLEAHAMRVGARTRRGEEEALRAPRGPLP